MINKLIKAVLFACTLIVTNANAQKLSITYFPEVRVSEPQENNLLPEQKVTEDEEFNYVLPARVISASRKVIIRKISKKTQKQVWEQTLPFESYNIRENSYWRGLEKTDEGFIAFVKKEDPKKKESYLTAFFLDEKFKIIKNEVVVCRSLNRDKNNMGSFFSFTVKRSGNHFLIFGNYSDDSDFIGPSYKFTIIDEKANVVLEKEIEISQKEHFRLKHIQVETDLSFTAMFYVALNGKSTTARSGNMLELKVVNYNYPKNEVKAAVVNLTNEIKSFGEEIIVIDTTLNRLKMLGQCQRIEKTKDLDCIFNLSYDLNRMEQVFLHIVPFDIPFLEKMGVDKKEVRNETLTEHFVIQNHFTNTEGENYYLLEKQDVDVRKAPGEQQSASSVLDRTYYQFKNMLVIKTDNKGQTVWVKIIRKFASAQTTAYTATESFYINESLIVLFNARITSESQPEKYGFMYGSEPVLVAMVYDKNGTLISQDNFKPKDAKNAECSISSIKKIDNQTLELRFDLLGRYDKVEAKIGARIKVE